MRGAFVVLEGLDKSGKTTQTKALCQRLGAQPLRFPFRESPTGRVIDEFLTRNQHVHDRAIHLLFSANRWEKAKWIEDTVSAGQSIICDRYAYSGVAYTAAKGIDADWCKTSDAGLPKPDIVFLFYSEASILQDRGDFGREKYEIAEFQEKVSRIFDTIMPHSCVRVNANDTIDNITDLMIHHIQGLDLSLPLQTLW